LTQWYLFGNPSPSIETSLGNPSPCFNNNGDSNWHSGAYSKQTFDYSNGLVIESDLFVNDARFTGCWVSTVYGIASLIPSETSFGTVVGVYYSAVGPACWIEPERQGHGHLTYLLINESGQVESHDILGGIADTNLGSWHHYKIVIRPDRYVEFYRDGILDYTSQSRISLNYINMPIVLGERSHSSYGPALHDNVKVTATQGGSLIAKFSSSPLAMGIGIVGAVDPGFEDWSDWLIDQLTDFLIP